MIWHLHDNYDLSALGFLPSMLNEDDPRSAREQFDSGYSHGGGWRPQAKFKMEGDGTLAYPGDPPLTPFALTKLRDEIVRVYPYGYVSITQPNGSFEVCRMD